MPDDGYAGPAALITADLHLTVDVKLGGRVEPVDGRYHWGGRIAAHDETARLLRSGVRAVQLRIGEGPAVPARLAEVDPWGGVRITATGTPPWNLEEQ